MKEKILFGFFIAHLKLGQSARDNVRERRERCSNLTELLDGEGVKIGFEEVTSISHNVVQCIVRLLTAEKRIGYQRGEPINLIHAELLVVRLTLSLFLRDEETDVDHKTMLELQNCTLI